METKFIDKYIKVSDLLVFMGKTYGNAMKEVEELMKSGKDPELFVKGIALWT